jgi:hypothetical protein
MSREQQQEEREVVKRSDGGHEWPVMWNSAGEEEKQATPDTHEDLGGRCAVQASR